MRLWSLHPKYLDARGLLALWREALLAQRVLAGGTRGYRHHPQLLRFRQHEDPLAAIGGYLGAVAEEGRKRGYRFDTSKIEAGAPTGRIPLTTGQLLYELQHLKLKLQTRDSRRYQALLEVQLPDPHPSFVLVEGPVEPWERRQ